MAQQYIYHSASRAPLQLDLSADAAVMRSKWGKGSQDGSEMLKERHNKNKIERGGKIEAVKKANVGT